MSYSHMTYALDLGGLRALWGCKDDALLQTWISACASDLDGNDGFFEDMYEDDDEDEDEDDDDDDDDEEDDEEDEEEEEDDEGKESARVIDSRTALREIFAGSVSRRDGSVSASVYGYVLKIVCEQLGDMLYGDVAEIAQHPYDSLMLANRSPLPIPVHYGDFPEVYHLPLAQIPDEIARIDAALALGDAIESRSDWKPMDADELIEDMQAYRGQLEEAQRRGLSLVSFRH